MTKAPTHEISNELLTKLLARDAKAAAFRGRPRGAALQEVLRENPAIAQQLDRIRADSTAYTREGLRRLVTNHRAPDVDFRELRKSALEQRPTDNRAEHLRLSSMRLITASSSDPVPLSGEIALTQDPNQQLHAHIDGDGLGWTLEPAMAFAMPFGFAVPVTTDKWNEAVAGFSVDFNAPAEGQYILTVTLAAYGTYALAADDGWPDSKNARASVIAAIDGKALTPSMYSDMNAVEFFAKGDDNILETGSFSGIETLKSMVYLKKGSRQLWASIKAQVSARGEGSIADLDLSGTTGGAACLAFSVTPI